MFPFRDHNPSQNRPVVTWALIALNVLIFVITLPLEGDPQALGQLYDSYALVPARFSDGAGLHTLFTSAFLHAGVMHLGGNMLFLWIFGDNMEDQMGRLGFVVFYLACAAAAGLAQTLSAPGSPVPMVGASGAIAGVMGGYLLMFPKARVDILVILIVIIRTFPLPAWVVLGLWFGAQLLFGMTTPTDAGGVAYWAHAGGFVAGLALTVPLWRARGGTTFWQRARFAPPHPEARPVTRRTRIPAVKR